MSACLGTAPTKIQVHTIHSRLRIRPTLRTFNGRRACGSYSALQFENEPFELGMLDHGGTEVSRKLAGQPMSHSVCRVLSGEKKGGRGVFHTTRWKRVRTTFGCD